MPGLHEHQDPSEEIFMQDVVLDVVSVVFNAKRQQLQDQAQELDRAGVLALRLVVDSVGQQGS